MEDLDEKIAHELGLFLEAHGVPQFKTEELFKTVDAIRNVVLDSFHKELTDFVESKRLKQN